MKTDLNLLAVFDAIFAEGNLSRAAQRLGMSQPATSNALARLRSTLGDPLFRRTARGMIPTARARLLAQPVRQALDLLHSAVNPTVTFDYQSSERCFVLAVEDYGEAVIVPRLLDLLRQAAPRLQLNVRPIAGRALSELLLPGEADLAISYVQIKASGFRNRRLMQDSLVSMVREDHPEVGAVLPLEQYLALSHVIIMPPSTEGPIVDRVLRKSGLERHVALQVQNVLSLPLMVKNTDFVCTLPRRIANIYAESFRLRILETPVACPMIPLYIVWHHSLDSEPGHAWLRDSIWELCQRL